MYYNGKGGKHVSSFMNEVHQAMIAKYMSEPTISTDATNAEKLQKFFQQLKLMAKGMKTENGSIADNLMMNDLLTNIQSHLSGNERIWNIFGRGSNAQATGTRFEKTLTLIYQAVYESIAETENFLFDASQVNIGSSIASSVNLSEALLSDSSIQNMLKKIGTKTQKKIIDSEGNSKMVYYLKDVSGKIDVKGYEIQIKANPSAELLEIYNLLKDATFSAKSYSSMTWSNETKSMVASQISELSLGHTNLYRAIVGTLEDLGYDSKTATSGFWAGYNRINGGDSNVSTHFYHIRYVYEMIGAGIKYNGVSYGTAKYLIYNDPTTDNIYVQSTAKLLADVLNHSVSGNPFGHMGIKKSHFY